MCKSSRDKEHSLVLSTELHRNIFAVCGGFGTNINRYVEHTALHYREELWIPELMDRRVPMAWAIAPADMVDNARARARELLAQAPNRCPLSEEQRAEVAGIVAAADRRVSETTR